ncbi:MAG: DNA polymerase IV [Bacteroidetes bacterium]|nr:DNA polymerase IV [Bacteroidota bacterium]
MSAQQRIVSHLDLDTFFVSVECLKNSRLKGKPLLIGGKSDRAVVAACSYEARKFGVHSAMAMKLARRLCPHATVLQGDFEEYSKFSTAVTDIIREEVPAFEKASIDEFYIDMTGMDKHFGCSKFTRELKSKITRETGLPLSYGLSANKLVSKVATNEAKPNGQLQIPFGNERQFLAPLPVRKMPMIGEKTADTLKSLGIRIIRTIAEMPVNMLESVFGKNGTELWRKANGIDDSPVRPYREQKSISTEETFENDTIDVDMLLSTLVRMTQKIAFELRSQNRMCSTVSIKMRYANFDTVSKQASIDFTCSDHILIPKVKDLFQRLYDRRLLVRLIGVRFTNLVPGNYQINLFEDTDEYIRLYKTLDEINTRYGGLQIMRASSLKH